MQFLQNYVDHRENSLRNNYSIAGFVKQEMFALYAHIRVMQVENDA